MPRWSAAVEVLVETLRLSSLELEVKDSPDGTFLKYDFESGLGDFARRLPGFEGSGEYQVFAEHGQALSGRRSLRINDGGGTRFGRVHLFGDVFEDLLLEGLPLKFQDNLFSYL